MKHGSLPTNAIIFLTILLAATVPSWARDRDAAWNWYAQGVRQHQAGNPALAEESFAKALEYLPGFSEVFFFRAEQLIHQQETTLAGLAWLDKALESDSWYRTDPLDGQKLKASVLLRIGKPEEAQRLMAAAAQETMDAEVFLLLNLAYAGLGSWERAEEGFAQALLRFPDEIRLYVAYLRLLKERSETLKAGALLDTALSRFPGDSSLLLLEIQLTESETLGLEKIQKYYELGGGNPLAAVLALEIEEQGPAGWEKVFLENGGNVDMDLLGRFLALAQETSHLPEGSLDSIRNYTGIRIRDQNEDGYYEDRYTFEAGGLKTWEWDPNQDGVADGRVDFESTKPKEITVRGEAERTYTYGPYPYIVQAVFSMPEYVRTYLLAPHAMAIPQLELATGDVLPSLPPFQSLSAFPSEPEIRGLAFRYNEHRAGSPVESKKVTLYDGRAVTSHEDRNGDGTVDYVLLYEDGAPVTALGDIDYDGAFDVLETWVDGERLSIAYDSDQDKTYDFFETLTKDGTIKEWDINGDGTMDLREYSVEGGGIAWEYASRLNGVFDVRRVGAGPMESGEEP